MKTATGKMAVCIFSTLALLLLLSGASAETAVFPDNNLQIVLVKYDPSPAEPGGYADVFLRLQANGVDLHNIQLRPVDGFPFTALQGEDVKEISILRNRETAQVSFRLRVSGTAYAGSHNLRFRYIADEIGDWVVSTPPFSVTVKTREAAVEIESVVAEEIAQGSTGTVAISLRNNAQNTLKDVTARLDLSDTPFATVGTSSEKKLYTLAPDQQASFSFDIAASPDAKNKVYRVPLYVTYRDEDGTAFSRNTTFGVQVGGKPEFQADLARSDTFIVGNSGSLTVSIANTGLTDLRFLSVALMDTPAYRVLSVPRVYLGDLEPDDFETVDFTIFVNKPSPLVLNLSYKDAYNKQYSSIVELPYPTYTKSEARKYGLLPASRWPGVLLTIVIIAGVIVAFVKRKELLAMLSGRSRR